MSITCVIIGAGNLATHLAIALKNSGQSIAQVFNRSEIAAKELSEKINTDYTVDYDQVNKDASVYFVAVKDDAIEEVLSNIKLTNKLLIHCSGSTPMSILSKYSTNYGVLYPLQTFTKNRELNFSEIPLFIEANSQENLQTIRKVANELSSNITEINSEKRQALHVSAVFACNFVNHLYSLSSKILKQHDLSFDVLKPLIEETANKIQDLDPNRAQTGPAVRYDERIITKHLETLQDEPDLAQLYYSLTKSIFKLQQK